MTIETKDVVGLADYLRRCCEQSYGPSVLVSIPASAVLKAAERIDVLERENAELRVDDSDEAVEARIRAHGAGSHQGWPRTSDGRSW